MKSSKWRAILPALHLATHYICQYLLSDCTSTPSFFPPASVCEGPAFLACTPSSHPTVLYWQLVLFPLIMILLSPIYLVVTLDLISCKMHAYLIILTHIPTCTHAWLRICLPFVLFPVLNTVLWYTENMNQIPIKWIHLCQNLRLIGSWQFEILL